MKTFVLRSPEIADRACAHIRSLVGGETLFAVTVVEADRRRTLEQSDKFHKQCRLLADEAWINGAQLTAEGWKSTVKLLGGFTEEFVNGATGQLIVAPKSTAKMGVKEMSELIEWTTRYAAEHHGVEV